MWKPSITPDDVLMHYAKGTRAKEHKYVDIINGRYIYKENGKKTKKAKSLEKKKNEIDLSKLSDKEKENYIYFDKDGLATTIEENAVSVQDTRTREKHKVANGKIEVEKQSPSSTNNKNVDTAKSVADYLINRRNDPVSRLSSTIGKRAGELYKDSKPAKTHTYSDGTTHGGGGGSFAKKETPKSTSNNSWVSDMATDIAKNKYNEKKAEVKVTTKKKADESYASAKKSAKTAAKSTAKKTQIKAKNTEKQILREKKRAEQKTKKKKQEFVSSRMKAAANRKKKTT